MLTRSSMLALLVLSLALVMSAGCSRSLMVARPEDKRLDAAYSELFTEESLRNVQDGDIVLRRGYAVLSDIITFVTIGPSVSHAGIYDATTGTIIEALDGGVGERSLPAYVGGSHRVVIVRPKVSKAERRAAVMRARAAIGTPFDYSGFIGLDDPQRFYCSELVVWAYGADQRGFDGGTLVAPGELAVFGDIVYDSGDRGSRPLVAVHPYWRDRQPVESRSTFAGAAMSNSNRTSPR
jgi:hypothetical protein